MHRVGLGKSRVAASRSLRVIDLVGFKCRHFKTRRKIVHVETGRTIAVAADQQPTAFLPNVDLGLNDADDRLPR